MNNPLSFASLEWLQIKKFKTFMLTLFYLSNYFICLVGYFSWFFTVRHTAGKWVLTLSQV